MDTRLNLFDFTRPALGTWFQERGEPRFRADQVFTGVYQRGATDFEALTDLPKRLRADLAMTLDLTPLSETRRLVSPEDGALKFLWRLRDAKEIEGVLMRADYGETICFSTQVGCAFNCGFCITAKMGRLRNLTPGEIVAQIVVAERERGAVPAGANLVAMGMGEPLDNLDSLLTALEILHDPLGLNVSGRRITVSTVGVVPGIRRLAEADPSVGLALSLNATTNEVRETIMPVTRKWPLEQVLEAVEVYAKASSRRITLEYVLIKGINDTLADADRLGKIAARFPSKINVIPFNPSELFPFERPDPEQVDAFARRLWPSHAPVTVRYSKGLDILAACGQLGYDQVKHPTAGV